MTRPIILITCAHSSLSSRVSAGLGIEIAEMDFTLGAKHEAHAVGSDARRGIYYLFQHADMENLTSDTLLKIDQLRRNTSVITVYVDFKKAHQDEIDRSEWDYLICLDRVGVEQDAGELQFLVDLPKLMLRPDWDIYFMRLAFLASSRSNCLKRRVGAVVVNNNRLVSTGYNGTPTGATNCFEGGCPRCLSDQPSGTALEACSCLHAEVNALLEAGRPRCMGSSLYVTTFPCLGCAKMILQSGIRKVYFSHEYPPGAGREFLEKHEMDLHDMTDFPLLTAFRHFFP